ncbi:DUF4112 domain-containing protein [Tsuneonella mangrovi]|uniref:DUF4112 domain-containing protein n=1 Tax=Tsuneonella mangrovi TaxID=1982042 RepID=UPI000BA2950F|nr:DUF4112 domain-containing protein [Tsuneonella mangrovi]
MIEPNPSTSRVQRMPIDLPIGNDPASIRRRLEAMEQLLENAFEVPGTKMRVGLDAIVGLIPVIGDLITTAMGAWIVWEARNLGLPKWKLWRMAGNVAFDTAIGVVPVVGDAADFLFRSNTRNLKIVKRHLDKHHPAQRTIEG